MGRLSVYTVEKKVNMTDYYSTRGSFLASKLFQKFIEAFVRYGKIIFSNKKLVGDFECTERGLQYAFTQLEKNDLFYREFTDDTKLNRTGFKMNLDKVIEIIELRPKHVKDFERGDIRKSIVTQMALTFKRDIRGLRRAMTNAKKAQNVEKYQNIKNEILKIKEEYRLHVETRISRYNHYKELEIKEIEYPEVIKGFTNILISFDFEPPELNQN